jgi:predicted esterase
MRRWIPWIAGAGAAAAGLLGGTAIVRAATRDCSGATDEGGTVEGVPYLERMRGGAASADRVPMVVLLHPRDATPAGYASGLNGIGRARLVVPQGGYDSPYGGYLWFPKGLLSTLGDGFDSVELRQWKDAQDRLERFVTALARCRPTAGEPIVTGSSQGAEMSLVMATLARRRIGGAVAVNGDMPTELWGGRMAPTVMLHGTGDTTVPFATAQQHATDAIARGAPLRFESFPSSGHTLTNAQTQAWRDEVEAFVTQQASR